MTFNSIDSHILKDTLSDKTILAVFAHPDDETFGAGGTLARYAAEGAAVHYVCATRGEMGEVDEGLLAGCRDLADLRVQELSCAARTLGLAGFHFLDYRDSGVTGSVDNSHPNSLVQAPREEVVGKIVYLIRRFQPQIVLTFDPVGGYFHSDHIAIHRATTEAFRLAGDPCRYPEHLDQNLRPFQPQKLYYTAVSRRLLKIIVALMPLLGMDPTAFGRNKDVNLKRVAEAEQIITTSLDIRSYLHTRIKASACYRSQGSGRFLGPRWIQRWFFSKESYTRAVPPVNGEGKMPVESDFFE